MTVLGSRATWWPLCCWGRRPCRLAQLLLYSLTRVAQCNFILRTTTSLDESCRYVRQQNIGIGAVASKNEVCGVVGLCQQNSFRNVGLMIRSGCFAVGRGEHVGWMNSSELYCYHGCLDLFVCMISYANCNNPGSGNWDCCQSTWSRIVALCK